MNALLRLFSHLLKRLPLTGKQQLPVTYDAALLDRLRLQWHLGDWPAMLQVKRDSLEAHPDRAQLAMLIASAHAQTNSPQQAREFAQAATEWGCDKRLIAQLLVAGTHNSLARASALLGDESRAIAHFRASVASDSTSGDHDAVCMARSFRELKDLGFLSLDGSLLERMAAPTQHAIAEQSTLITDSPANAAPAANESVKKIGIVSYAQNFEDVMLWRALQHIKNGFYIDVGAQHPIIDSVSKAFYDHGWRGIHVEAIAEYANLLRQERPDEPVLEVALSDNDSEMLFYSITDTGLSTGKADIANMHRQKGFNVTECRVPCMTLANVFTLARHRDIHWLKIDVEGMEAEVLSGWGNSEVRPWIIVVEATLPSSQIEVHQQWEHYLLERHYQFVYFDGLNRFYVAEEHPELMAAFTAGPNVFDGFRLHNR